MEEPKEYRIQFVDGTISVMPDDDIAIRAMIANHGAIISKTEYNDKEDN